MGKRRSTPIPGLSFSLKRALGISRLKVNASRKTGVPTTKGGVERKVGKALLKLLFGRWK